MTANRDGISVSSNTMRWLSIIVAICALGGPPATLAVGMLIFTKTQVLIDKSQDERAAELKVQVERETRELRTAIARTDVKFDKISDDIADVKQVLNQLVGKFNK